MFQISLHKLFFHHLHYWWCLPSRRYLVWDISFATDTYFNFDNYNRNFFLVNREWNSCVQIIELMLRIQRQLILTDFLSKILWNESDGGKCLCNNLKNILPMLVLTFFEYGGLNQIIFRFHFLFSLLRSSEIFGST